MNSAHLIRPLFLAFLFTVCAVSAEAGEGGGPLVAGLLFGGSENEHITSSARMTNGDLVVCGWTESYDIPVSVPSFKATNSGGRDAFVAVLSLDLKTVKAFTFYGGAQDDLATCVAVDPTGRIVVIGETESPDLAMATGSISQVYSANIDGFIVVFNSNLTLLQRSSYLNGIGDEHPTAIAVDPNGGVYFCGYTNSRSGFPTNNGYDRSHNGSIDGFVCKVDASLSTMQ
ncbi:MAG: SBBP repeat-containing protein, partial [Candidatus Kapabacteria bacterium]|nr:SBBP repeat-containing protein [Candidatus Kapabacteria bacterium]